MKHKNMRRILRYSFVGYLVLLMFLFMVLLGWAQVKYAPCQGEAFEGHPNLVQECLHQLEVNGAPYPAPETPNTPAPYPGPGEENKGAPTQTIVVSSPRPPTVYPTHPPIPTEPPTEQY